MDTYCIFFLRFTVTGEGASHATYLHFEGATDYVTGEKKYYNCDGFGVTWHMDTRSDFNPSNCKNSMSAAERRDVLTRMHKFR